MIYAYTESGGSPWVKIGSSRKDCASWRMRACQTGNPRKLELVACTDWPVAAEREIRAFLKNERPITGGGTEWYFWGKERTTFVLLCLRYPEPVRGLCDFLMGYTALMVDDHEGWGRAQQEQGTWNWPLSPPQQ